MRLYCLVLAMPLFLESAGKPPRGAPKEPLVQIASGALQGMQHGNTAIFEGISTTTRISLKRLQGRDLETLRNIHGNPGRL